MSRARRLALWSVLALAAAALAPADEPARPPVEELYRGELDDTGPQYLLVPAAARPRRFTLWTRADGSWTDNATFTEAHPSDTSVLSLQAGGEARLLERTARGGRLTLDAGARVQVYRYGIAGGDDRVIDTLQVDRNNFDLAGAHLRAAWQRGAWLVFTSAQGAGLRNRSSGRTFYRELTCDAGVLRQWRPRQNASLLVGADLARRWTVTDTYGLLPQSWNDRADLGLNAIWQQTLRGRWSWRASARAAVTDYTHADRSRRDATGTLGAELVWTWRDGCDVRIFVSHERRDSTEPTIADYARWEAGLGAGLHWNF